MFLDGAGYSLRHIFQVELILRAVYLLLRVTYTRSWVRDFGNRPSVGARKGAVFFVRVITNMEDIRLGKVLQGWPDRVEK